MRSRLGSRVYTRSACAQVMGIHGRVHRQLRRGPAHDEYLPYSTPASPHVPQGTVADFLLDGEGGGSDEDGRGGGDN